MILEILTPWGTIGLRALSEEEEETDADEVIVVVDLLEIYLAFKMAMLANWLARIYFQC